MGKSKNMLQNLTEDRAGRALKEGLEELLAHLIRDEWWTDGAPPGKPHQPNLIMILWPYKLFQVSRRNLLKLSSGFLL